MDWLREIPDDALNVLAAAMVHYVYELSKGHAGSEEERALEQAVLAEVIRRGRDPYEPWKPLKSAHP